MRVTTWILLGLATQAWGAPAPAPGPTPDEVLKDLQAGNARFSSSASSNCTTFAARRKELALGQSPRAIILSCSDSRVPPELIFDQGVGELFVVRVAGNALEASSMATIEYAIAHLGARLIVVMGHEACGAIKAVLTTPPGSSAGSEDLDRLVALLRSHMSAGDLKPEALNDKTLIAPARHNVEGVAKELVSRSALLKKEVDSKRVRIVRAVYHFESGKAEFF